MKGRKCTQYSKMDCSKMKKSKLKKTMIGDTAFGCKAPGAKQMVPGVKKDYARLGYVNVTCFEQLRRPKDNKLYVFYFHVSHLFGHTLFTSSMGAPAKLG